MQPDEQPTKALVKKSSKTINLWVAIGLIITISLASFIAGTRSQSWLLALSGKTAGQLDFSSLQATYEALAGKFDGQLDVAKLTDGAKKGLVDAAGDPYTVYFTDAEAKQFLNSLDGSFSGIGAELGLKNKNLVIVSTLDDSPARKAGMAAGDIVAKVNDQETTGWSIEKAVSQIRGDKGTTVKLLVVRGQEVKEYSIVRAELVDPSVKTDMLADNIGYMRISRFAEDTAGLAKRAAQDFKDKGVKGIIVDLRGDGGGYLTTAQGVASLWLKEGEVIVEEREGDKVTDTLKATGGNILSGMPTVMLIDGGSASASEIVAGALRDHGAAQLVGEKTFGKGSVQEIVDVPGGGQLKVTIAKWYTPKGKNISKEGIAPDSEVSISDADATAGNDTQRLKAIELLKNR